MSIAMNKFRLGGACKKKGKRLVDFSRLVSSSIIDFVHKWMEALDKMPSTEPRMANETVGSGYCNLVINCTVQL